MGTFNMTHENFEESVRQGIVFIDWWAAWCGPCRAFAPVYESVAAKHPDIRFAKVDTEAEPELAEGFQIRAIPTLMILRDGVLLYASPGALGAHALEELVERVRALDMDEVRRRLAESEGAASGDGAGPDGRERDQAEGDREAAADPPGAEGGDDVGGERRRRRSA